MPRNPFLEHPSAVGESYWEHARAALRISVHLALAAAAAGVHAWLPFLFPRSASAIVARLHRELHERSTMATSPARERPGLRT